MYSYRPCKKRWRHTKYVLYVLYVALQKGRTIPKIVDSEYHIIETNGLK
jgi:hypothetical protein